MTERILQTHGKGPEKYKRNRLLRAIDGIWTNFNIERQRIIILIEGDHQLNAKRLSKIVRTEIAKTIELKAF